MNRLCWAASILAIALGAAAFAQTGGPLLLQPWPATEVGGEPRHELHTSTLVFGDADLDRSDHDLGYVEFESRGRMKLTHAPGPGPALGYEALYYDLSTRDDALPSRLADVSVAAAFGVPLGDDDWEAGLVAGVGYAGARPFADGDAVYFMGDLIFKRSLDDRSSLVLALSYDGNRAFFPDLPLPGGYYARRVSDTLSFTIGMPYSSVRWSLADRWTVSATASAFALPFLADVTVEYELARHLSLFGSFSSRRPAFWLEDDDNRRLFFQQRRLEAGVRYDARDGVSLLLAGGWAFDQDFEVGWDVRDTDKLRELDDAAFLRFAVELAF